MTENDLLTLNEFTTGIGVGGSCDGPFPSHHEYCALSVLIIVQQAPSFIISLFGSLGHSVA
jgi:hypothetical protein